MATPKKAQAKPIEDTPVGRPPHIADKRKSQPPWMIPAMLNSFAFIPRRDALDPWGNPQRPAIMPIERLIALAALQPLRVLSWLPDLVPEVGKGVWNFQRLACHSDSVRLRAMKKSADGSMEEAKDGTAAIQDLFTSLPPEVGGFVGALSQNFLMTLFSGMCAVEAVPGKRNEGILQVWPIDCLTLRMKRDKVTGYVELWQRQLAPKTYLYGSSEMQSGYVHLPDERMFWRSMDGFPEDPYGRAPMAPLLLPVLDLMTFMKDLLLAWHRVGSPKWDIGFDFKMFSEVARDVLGMVSAEQIRDYVQQEFERTKEMFDSLEADDSFFHDTSAKVSANGSGGAWPNVKPIFDILRWRIVTAMKQMPTLMGLTEGSTETWSGVDWQIHAKAAETMVEIAADPLIQASQLHLQLLGLPYVVEAEYAAVRANQRMVDAQAEQIEIANEQQKVYAGWETNDDAAMRVTGSGAVSEMDKDALGISPKPLNGDTSNSGAASKPKPENKVTKGPSKGAYRFDKAYIGQLRPMQLARKAIAAREGN